MIQTEISAIESTVRKAHEWLDTLVELGDFFGPQQAYTALHAVLQTLRDTLPPNEAVQLAAGMPMLIRGLYLEGWDLAKCPHPMRSKNAFIDRVAQRLRNSSVDPEHACRAVFALLDDKVDSGELEDVRSVLHHRVRVLFD
jgi:uncharacterized protein (DUF2267 family)